VIMKKTIWMPLVLGGALGLVDFVSLVVNFLIPLGPFGATGPQEIFIIMSAALGGPLGLLVANILHEMGILVFFLVAQFSPEQISSTGVIFASADFTAHLLASLAVAYGYRFLYHRGKKVSTFVAGWVLIVVIYYALLVLLQSSLLGFIIPDKPPISVLYQNNLPEFLVVATISTLIWIALPARFRKPVWIELQPVPQPTKDGSASTEIQI
jgi:hypothetical protein